MHQPIRVMHGLHNIAGIPSTLADFERRLGLDSRSVCYPTKYYSEQVSEFIERGASENLERFVEQFDIFNFHFGESFLGQSLADIKYLKQLGKKVLLHYHGCDIRDSKLTLERHPVSVCSECWPVQCNANRKISAGVRDHYADLVTVSTPDLFEFLPQAVWLPQAVNLDYIKNIASQEPPAFQRKDDGTIYIVHAPSASRLKGSRFIEAAVKKLQDRGLKVELILLTGMPHKAVLASVRAADIAIDQVLGGMYGVSAIEAMAFGKPTICYIRDDLKGHYPADLPIIDASIANLEEVIAQVAENRASWPDIGARSEAYALRHHDGSVIARRMSDVYMRLERNRFR